MPIRTTSRPPSVSPRTSAASSSGDWVRPSRPTATRLAPSEVASEPEPGGAPSYALRSVTEMYRTTPLRGLFHPPQLQGPYFHNGVAATLEDVVDRYVAKRSLSLTAQQKADLVEFLKSL